jgi:hypothetical protein
MRQQVRSVDDRLPCRWSIDWAAGGCVGGGEGTILASGPFLYHLIEAPDVSLAYVEYTPLAMYHHPHPECRSYHSVQGMCV